MAALEEKDARGWRKITYRFSERGIGVFTSMIHPRRRSTILETQTPVGINAKDQQEMARIFSAE